MLRRQIKEAAFSRNQALQFLFQHLEQRLAERVAEIRAKPGGCQQQLAWYRLTRDGEPEFAKARTALIWGGGFGPSREDRKRRRQLVAPCNPNNPRAP